MSKLNFEDFKGKIDKSWWRHLQPLIESEDCFEIYEHLKKRSKGGAKIAPLAFQTWRCFETPYDDIKAVLVSMCPYHTMVGDVIVADGLVFSCSNTNKLQPSLKQYYSAQECEFSGCMDFSMYEDPSLEFLAKQGVLLLNVALTTEIGQAGIHLDLWEPFMTRLFKDVLSLLGVPVIFAGKDAQKFNQYLPKDTWKFNIEHPSYAARQMRNWKTDGVFKKVKEIVKDMNGFDIKWYLETPWD